jgi:hypothetical protein
MNRRRLFLGITPIALTVLAFALAFTGTAAAHSGGTTTTRYQAKWQVQDILREDYGWYAFDVRCGSSTWTVGKHFPCTFTRLGRRYIVCYHSLDYDYGMITPYQSWSCKKYY